MKTLKWMSAMALVLVVTVPEAGAMTMNMESRWDDGCSSPQWPGCGPLSPRAPGGGCHHRKRRPDSRTGCRLFSKMTHALSKTSDTRPDRASWIYRPFVLAPRVFPETNCSEAGPSLPCSALTVSMLFHSNTPS